MNEILLHHGLVILGESAAIYYFAKQGFHWLNVLLIGNMIAVQFYAKLLIVYPFGESNLGNLFYGFVFPICFLIWENYGETAVNRVVRKTLLVLAVVCGYQIAVNWLPESATVAGNEETRNAYLLITKNSYLVLFASFWAFFISFKLFLEVVGNYKNSWVSYPIGLIVWHIVDSIIFFPILFWSVFGDTVKVLGFLWIGIVNKILIGLMLMPLVWVKCKK